MFNFFNRQKQQDSDDVLYNKVHSLLMEANTIIANYNINLEYEMENRIARAIQMVSERKDDPFESFLDVKDHKYGKLLHINSNQTTLPLFDFPNKNVVIPISTIGLIELSSLVDYDKLLQKDIDFFLKQTDDSVYMTGIFCLFNSTAYSSNVLLDGIREKLVQLFGGPEEAVQYSYDVDRYKFPKLIYIKLDDFNKHFVPSYLRIKTVYGASHFIGFDYFNEAELFAELFYIWENGETKCCIPQ